MWIMVGALPRPRVSMKHLLRMVVYGISTHESPASLKKKALHLGMEHMVRVFRTFWIAESPLLVLCF